VSIALSEAGYVEAARYIVQRKVNETCTVAMGNPYKGLLSASILKVRV